MLLMQLLLFRPSLLARGENTSREKLSVIALHLDVFGEAN
jgi:hypothetical protein